MVVAGFLERRKPLGHRGYLLASTLLLNTRENTFEILWLSVKLDDILEGILSTQANNPTTLPDAGKWGSYFLRMELITRGLSFHHLKEIK